MSSVTGTYFANSFRSVPTSTVSPPAPSSIPSASPVSATDSAPTSETLHVSRTALRRQAAESRLTFLMRQATFSTRSSAPESISLPASDKAGALATPTTAVATTQSQSRVSSPSTVAKATSIGPANNTHSEESVLMTSNLESLAGGLLYLGRMVIILAQLKEPIDVGF
jgi:hypothetical protein